MPTPATLTADLIARANDGDQDALNTIRDVARHALRLATLPAVARFVATGEIVTAILHMPAGITSYGTYVRQAARKAIADVAGSHEKIAEHEAAIRDACRKVTRGYPTVTPELLHSDVQAGLETMTDIKDVRRAAHHLARTALKRRMTADSGHGLGGEGDAKRGDGGLTQYLRVLTDDKRTSARAEERNQAALKAARQAVRDATTEAETSVALAKLDMLEARLVGEAQAETRSVWVYLDAVRDDGTSAAADFEIVATGETGETALSARWRDAIIDAAKPSLGWSLVKTTRAASAFWDGALVEVRRGDAGYKPSHYSLGATLRRAPHRDFYAADADITVTEWCELVTLLCGQDATPPTTRVDAAGIEHVIPGRPAQPGLLVELASRPDLTPRTRRAAVAMADTATVTPILPTPHTIEMEQAA